MKPPTASAGPAEHRLAHRRLHLEAQPRRAHHGVGEHVVSGEGTPDYYSLDRKGAIKRSRIVDQQVMSEPELAQLVELGLHLAELNGSPQDIEWAFDDTGLYLLQSRPVTTI